MIVVGILTPFLMAYRELARDSRAAGAWIVGACLILVTIKLYVEAIARVPSGETSKRWRRATLAIKSAANAFSLILVADITFLFVDNAIDPYRTREYVGLLAGGIMALWITRIMKRWVDHQDEG